MSETGRRVLTALALIPAVALVVLAAPPAAFQAVLVAVVAAGAWEWGRLAELSPAAGYAALAGVSLAAALGAGGGWLAGLAWVGAAWWLAALAAVLRFRALAPPARRSRLGEAAAGWLVLVPAGAGLAAVYAAPGGPALVMALLAIVWAADSGAWFAGRRFGRRRLAPRASPGKTWEGAAGGLAAGALAGAAAAWWLGRPRGEFVAVALLTVCASVVGDLYESIAKRRAGRKDSGRLLPGHGGVLDRIDGLTAAAPVYAVALA